MMQENQKVDVLEEPNHLLQWLRENGLLKDELPDDPVMVTIHDTLVRLRDICMGTLHGNTKLLLEFLISNSVLRADEDLLHDKILSLLYSRRGRSDSWVQERAQKLLMAAKQNPFQQTMHSSHLINLKVLITVILQYQEHLAESWNKS
nr:hypothetical protein [Paenibacillus nasutitermitis]